MVWTFALSAALAAAIEVESGHTASVALASPQVELEGHGVRLQIPAGWRGDMTSRMRQAGHVVEPDSTAELRLRPTVVASGCTERRGQVHCSAWVRWHLMVPGNDPVWQTESRGVGPDPAEASRATWLEAMDTLLGDPSFVQAVHYGPLGRYDCALSGQVASVPVRISPEPEANKGHGTYDDDWGGVHTIATESWEMDYSGSISQYHIAEYSNDDDYLVAANDKANAWDAGWYSRFDWTESAGDLWYCQIVYDAKTAEEAAASPGADPSDPAKGGCSGFSWSRLIPRGN